MGASIRYECCMTIGMIWSIHERAVWYGVTSWMDDETNAQSLAYPAPTCCVKRAPSQTRCHGESSSGTLFRWFNAPFDLTFHKLAHHQFPAHMLHATRTRHGMVDHHALLHTLTYLHRPRELSLT